MQEVLGEELLEALAELVLLRGISAVCGIGSPSGCRNSAVTANQSAMAPTMLASAPAFTKPEEAVLVQRDDVDHGREDQQPASATACIRRSRVTPDGVGLGVGGQQGAVMAAGNLSNGASTGRVQP